MKIQSLVELLIVLPESRSPETVIGEVERVLDLYGFDYYRLVKQAGNKQDADSALLAEKWPEKWLKHYHAKRYAQNDPLLRHLPVVNKPFRWRDHLQKFDDGQRYPRVRKMVSEAAEHGLQDGYIFPVHGSRGTLGRMSVSGKPVDLSPAEVVLFDAIAKTAFWHILELKNETQSADAAPALDAWLTPRETEVLRYLAEGMTSTQISQQLNISTHTVDWYMTGLQGKLNARNRQHAVAVAFRNGLL